jgi:hypothetical protein
MTGSTTYESLFETIEYTDQKSLGIFLDNLKSEQAIMILSEAVKHAFRNGIYTLNETEAVSRALRILILSKE